MADNLSNAINRDNNAADTIAAFNADCKAARLALRTMPEAKTSFLGKLFNR